MLKSGRPGDVACKRCGRPLLLNQAWKLKRANGRGVDYYCAEDVIITDRGTRWRPRTDKDPKDDGADALPAMGDRVKVAEPDVEPMTPVSELAADSLEHGIPYGEVPTGGPHYRAIEREPEPAAAPADDFDPLNDVGF